VVTAIALGAVIVSSVVLLSRYRPDWIQHGSIDSVDGYSPRAWVSLHEIAMDVAGVTVLIWFVTTLWLGSARSRRSIRADVAAALAFIGTWATIASWSHVRWNQVALWQVTVGANYTGLWRPAFSDQVRFVFVGGSEVSPHAYLAALLVHIAAPAVALLALGISTFLARRRPTPPAELPSVEIGGEVIRG
jgi:hypothetical protein